jgi:hypothetical protein
MPASSTWGWFHIARRDIRAAAAAPLLWLILAAWLGVVHGAFALSLLEVHGRSGAAATPLYVDALWWGGLVLALFAPALTMNAWAAERAQGSWQLLMTVPLREIDLVLGKFLAAWGLMLVLLAATIGMPATLAVISDVSPPHALACYTGLILLAAFLAALGTWIGLMVEGPVAAYILTFGVVAVLWLAGIGGSDGPLGPFAAAVGLGDRITSYLSGRIALADTAWFVAGSGLFLLLAHGAIVALRQSGSLVWWRRAGIIGGPRLLIAIVLVLGVAAAARSGLAVDLSADHRFTLSPALITQLSTRSAPVDLVGVWDDAVDGALGPVSDAAQRMAESARNGSWKRLDPVRHRPALADFAARHGDPGPPALWVVSGERANRIPLSRASRITLQRDVAGALIALDDPSPPTVRILQGHGELRPDSKGDDSCALLAGALAAAGLRVTTLDDAAPAPPASDVIAVLGAERSIGGTSLGRLDTHLRDGGGVLLLADDRSPSDLGIWLRRRGVLSAGAVPRALAEGGDPHSVLDPAAPCLPARHLVSLSRHWSGAERDLPHHNLLLRTEEHLNPQHPVTAPLVAGGLQLLSPFTAACEALRPEMVAEAGTPAFEAVPLMWTLPGDVWERSRGEPLQVPQGLEQASPRALAWALSYQSAADAASSARAGRLVVWGSRQAASDSSVGQAAFANGQALAGMCRWLAHRDAPPEVPEAELHAFQVGISDRALEILVAILAVLVPVICIGGALLAWLEQRR